MPVEEKQNSEVKPENASTDELAITEKQNSDVESAEGHICEEKIIEKQESEVKNKLKSIRINF